MATPPPPDESAPSAARRPRGRPRSAEAREGMLAAAYALLTEHGYAAVTFEAVAAHALVAKTTVYRGWPDRASLVIEAFLAAPRADPTFPDTGSAPEDLGRQVHAVGAALRGPAGAAIAAMVAGGREDPAVGRAVVAHWIAPVERWTAARLRRAQAEGACVPALDVAAALGALYGPLYAPLLLGLGAADAARVDAHLAVVCAGIFGPGAAGLASAGESGIAPHV